MSTNPVVPDNSGDPSNVGSLPITPQQTQSLDTPPAPPSGPARPGLWADVLKGALYGLSNVSQTKGRGSFGVGLAQGVQGEIAGQQREQQQQIQQQQIKFQSAQAAASMVEASKRSQLADIQIAEGKLNLAELADNVHAYNQALGIPDADVTISGQQPNDMNTQAAGALQTLSTQNGGTVPRVVTVDEPAHDANGNTHTVSVFASPSADDLSKAGGAYLKLVNDSRAVQGQPALSDQDWRTGQGTVPNTGAQNGMALLNAQRKWQGQQVMDAQKNLYQAPMPSDKPSENAATSAHLQQLLASYSARPDANPDVVSLLKSQQASFNSASETQRQLAAKAQAQTVTDTASAMASAAGQKAAAEQPFKQAQAQFEQTLKDGNPDDAGKMLAQGLIAPSQIISTRQPGFAQAALAAADKYSRQANGQPFNASAQEGYFNAAKSTSNVQFFGSAKSLTDKGGTLDQLQSAYNALPNGQLPAINKLSDWASAASGKGATAGFAQTAIGVADDYAKVLGGGQGSDSAREELLKSFAASHSPEQMSSAILAARKAIYSQMGSRVGSNPVMGSMYGSQIPDGVSRSKVDGKLYFVKNVGGQIQKLGAAE